jgi:hypothetical protein
MKLVREWAAIEAKYESDGRVMPIDDEHDVGEQFERECPDPSRPVRSNGKAVPDDPPENVLPEIAYPAQDAPSPAGRSGKTARQAEPKPKKNKGCPQLPTVYLVRV